MRRRGFTVTELLVAAGIILVLVSLIGGAVSAARSNAKMNSTRTMIDAINRIVQQQYSTYGYRPVISATTSTLRAAALRQLVSGDMPDTWSEVSWLASGSAKLVTGPAFPIGACQRAYIAYRASISPTSQYEDAECLFMIVMCGGLADCLDCGSLRQANIGDSDNDGALEFQDSWGNPIRFLLWPAGIQLPPQAGTTFFSTTPPFVTGAINPAPGGQMRPLVYSAGPDGKATLTVAAASNIQLGLDCGNPANPTVAKFGTLPTSEPVDYRADNITNLDAEAKQ